MKNIESLRENFYLDKDGECRWSYAGLIETDELGRRTIVKAIEPEEDLRNYLGIGQCHVCGKMPLKYNFVLKYKGTEKRNPERDYMYSSVGSECIQSLSESDLLKINRDRKLLKEQKDKENAMVIGKYITEVFLPQNSQLWKMSWTYFEKQKNIAGSLKFMGQKCSEGIAIQEKTFGKELKIALKESGYPLPGLKEMKEIVGKQVNKTPEIKPETPSKEIQKTEDLQAEDEAKIVPDGIDLKDIYGYDPITGKREIVYMILVDAKTGKEIKPSSEGIAPEWNPIIEIEQNGQTIKMHLQKWLKTKDKPMKPPMNPLLKALKCISGDDMDYASEENGIGFSGMDTEFGHSLASREFLTEKQIPYAKRLVKKYHKQLMKNYPEIWAEVMEQL